MNRPAFDEEMNWHHGGGHKLYPGTNLDGVVGTLTPGNVSPTIRLSREPEALAHLRALVGAMDNAFISSWQSTHAWAKELEEAKAFLSTLE